MSEPPRTIGLDSIPKHFDQAEAQQRWHEFWQQNGVHDYDPSKSREDPFVVDTPPPTASMAALQGS